MSKNRQKSVPQVPQIEEFFRESRRAFGEQYKTTWNPSVLMAQRDIEESVERELTTPAKALLALREPASFANLILKAEQKYQERQDQRIHYRMTKLERGTHWLIGLGMGVGFLIVSPFVTTALQPTADKYFKRQPTAQPAGSPQPPMVPNITNNNVYNFYAQDKEMSSEERPQTAKEKTSKSGAKLACKNETISTYNATLLELLQRGNVVTVEVNGKKASLCYRPNVRQMMALKAQP